VKQLLSPILAPIRGKGVSGAFARGRSIASRYGLSADKMAQALARLEQTLQPFGGKATLPVTAAALARHPSLATRVQAQGIELAVHGLVHIDHSQLPLAEQRLHLQRARHLFDQAGIRVSGFRSPYLRWNADTLVALGEEGFAYDSSQALAWDVVGELETEAYRHVLAFYGAQAAADHPSLPSLVGDLVRIPYSVPDDESLVERLQLSGNSAMTRIWLEILHRVYDAGELFTLGLHPERVALCQEALQATLEEASSLSPAVWIARLDEIAAWWRARAGATVQIADAGEGSFRVRVAGPKGTTVLARAADVDGPTAAWAGGYQRVLADTFTVHASSRPFLGVSPDTSPGLVDFLRQQGYILEIGAERERYAHYFDQAEFEVEQARPLLARIERPEHPLLRLGRWPDGAQSALAVSGDIDALTLWDYGLRFLGR
jgi:peptidoglycan/xylan/chitin deacetylase (PgdA/CDA1 family)